MNTDGPVNEVPTQEPAEGGYGSPNPAQGMPENAATTPSASGSTPRGKERGEDVLEGDKSQGTPEKFYAGREDAGSDSEPTVGRLGGTDDQYPDALPLSGTKMPAKDEDGEESTDAPP